MLINNNAMFAIFNIFNFSVIVINDNIVLRCVE